MFPQVWHPIIQRLNDKVFLPIACKIFEFREVRKCFRKTARFEYFAKQIIFLYLESSDHAHQNDV